MAKKILVADDYQPVREVHALILRDAGFEVIEASDGAIAFAAALALNPDLIITDLDMPRMDGVALKQQLEASQSTIPVVLITGNVVVQLENVSFRKVLSKPVNRDRLIEVAQECIG